MPHGAPPIEDWGFSLGSTNPVVISNSDEDPDWGNSPGSSEPSEAPVSP